MRDLTPFIIQKTTPDADGTLVDDTQVAAKITLRDGTPILVATALCNVTSKNELGTAVVVAETYQAHIQASPDVRFTLGRAADSGSLSLENLSRIYGHLIADASQVFDGCRIEVYVLFKKLDLSYERDTVFNGKVSSAKGDGNLADFTIVSDMNDKSAVVANRVITQHCSADFEDDRCGHSGAPPGSTCSKVKTDTVNGCRFWNWEHRFWGADFESIVEESATPTGFPTGTLPDLRPIFSPGYQPPGGGATTSGGVERLPSTRFGEVFGAVN
jgi:hypothetical protein